MFSIKETVTIFAMSRATALLSWGTGNSLRCEHIQIEDNWTIAHVLEPPFHRHKNRGTEKLNKLFNHNSESLGSELIFLKLLLD